jgi:hypothetical protein
LTAALRTAHGGAVVCFTGAPAPDQRVVRPLRERFDAGSAFVALGAIALLVSLFVDWYEPSLDAWAAFEFVDLLLAGIAVFALVALAPRFAPLARWLPLVAGVALVVVAVQLIDPPPAARGADLDSGAWLALAATALMALGALLAAASISITVDVRGRERRRRAAAIDAREGAPAPDEACDDDEAEPEPSEDATPPSRGGRLFGRPGPRAGAGSGEDDDGQRTQALDPVDPDQDRTGS